MTRKLDEEKRKWSRAAHIVIKKKKKSAKAENKYKLFLVVRFGWARFGCVYVQWIRSRLLFGSWYICWLSMYFSFYILYIIDGHGHTICPLSAVSNDIYFFAREIEKTNEVNERKRKRKNKMWDRIRRQIEAKVKSHC